MSEQIRELQSKTEESIAVDTVKDIIEFCTVMLHGKQDEEVEWELLEDESEKERLERLAGSCTEIMERADEEWDDRQQRSTRSKDGAFDCSPLYWKSVCDVDQDDN